MGSSRPWKDVDEFLDLFGVDKNKKGVVDFKILVTLTALMDAFPEYGKTFHHVATWRMGELRWHGKFFYGRIRQAMKPVFDASPDTLAGLGLKITGALTVPELVKAFSKVLRVEYDEKFRILAEWTAELIENGPKDYDF